MKINILQNGVTRMAVTPETEIEKVLLQALFQGQVEVTYQEKLQAFDKALVDSYVIAPAPAAKKEEI